MAYVEHGDVGEVDYIYHVCGEFFFFVDCSLFRIHFPRLSSRLSLLSLLRILYALLRNMPLVLVYPKLSAFWLGSLCKVTWDSQHSSLKVLHL